MAFDLIVTGNRLLRGALQREERGHQNVQLISERNIGGYEKPLSARGPRRAEAGGSGDLQSVSIRKEHKSRGKGGKKAPLANRAQRVKGEREREERKTHISIAAEYNTTHTIHLPIAGRRTTHACMIE